MRIPFDDETRQKLELSGRLNADGSVRGATILGDFGPADQRWLQEQRLERRMLGRDQDDATRRWFIPAMRSYERDLTRLGIEELGRRASPHGFAGDMLKIMQDKHREVLDSAPNDDARQLAEYALRGRHERIFQGFLAQERRLGLRSDVENAEAVMRDMAADQTRAPQRRVLEPMLQEGLKMLPEALPAAARDRLAQRFGRVLRSGYSQGVMEQDPEAFLQALDTGADPELALLTPRERDVWRREAQGLARSQSRDIERQTAGILADEHLFAAQAVDEPEAHGLKAAAESLRE